MQFVIILFEVSTLDFFLNEFYENIHWRIQIVQMLVEAVLISDIFGRFFWI